MADRRPAHLARKASGPENRLSGYASPMEPVEHLDAAPGWRLCSYGDYIIPSRANIQFVEHVDILHKTHTGLVRRKSQTIEVNIFMLEIRSKTDNVTLIRNDIDKCEPTIKASQSGKFLSSFRPDFDREAEVSLRSEVERGNRMDYARCSPVIDEQVQRTQVGQIEIPGVVARGEIRGASIFEISDIVNRKAVSVTTGVSEDRNLRLP